VLSVGSLCVCTVLRVTPTMCTVTILSNSIVPLNSPNTGTIRAEDVTSVPETATEEGKESSMFDNFRLGDVVQARVISLGDVRSFYLSTAEEHLGVVKAVSEGGENMVPVNWREMGCSGGTERRKVAKPMMKTSDE